MHALKATEIFNGSYIIPNGVIIWDKDKIIDIGYEDILLKYPNINCQTITGLISPGFIDIQVNGAGGADFYGTGITIETLQIMSRTLKKYGCTSFCPTLITSSDEDINKALDLVNNSSSLDLLGILGLHIEGPMFSQEHKGAHNPDLIRVLSQELIDKICISKVKIISLSPEVAPLKYISQLSHAGIRVSVAHTNATLEEIRSGERAGTSLGTHLYNGMSRFNSRKPNTVGALLTSKTSYISIIPDGNHCDFNSVIMAHKCLGNRLITITDGIIAMGTNITNFKIGFQNVYINEQNCCIGDYGGLAGSIITPIECIRNLINHCEFSLIEALASYTSSPAKALGLEKSIGYLNINNNADFIILDKNELNIQMICNKGTLQVLQPKEK